MDPVQTVKSAITPAKLIGIALTITAIFAILDFANVTDWILYPVTQIKAKLGKG